MKILLQLVIGILLVQTGQAWAQEISGRFYPEKKSYVFGEPIFVVLEQTNVSSRVIDLDDGHCIAETRFEALTASRLVSPKGPGGSGGSCGSTIAPWAPGVTVKRRFLLDLPFRLVLPGVYSIRARHTVHIFPFGADPQPPTTEEIITDFEISLSPSNKDDNSTSRAERFEIRLPSSLASAQVQIQYFVTGAFGGYGSFVKAEPGKKSYLITTEVNGQPAKTLKVVIYSPGCQIADVSVPTLSLSSRTTNFKCQSLPSLSFRGRITQPELLKGHEYEIEVRLSAHWAMGFFGYNDGFVPTFYVARVTPAGDGAFEVQLPNFTRDAVTSSFGTDRAQLQFVAREKDTGNVLGGLQPLEAQYDQFRDLRLLPAYLDEVIFGMLAVH